MRYAAFYGNEGKITSVAMARSSGVEITHDEYNAYLAEISASVPEQPAGTDEISAEEALDIILGGESV